MSVRARTATAVAGGIAALAIAPAGPAWAAGRVTGPVAGATRMHVTVTLRPRNPAAMAAYARAVQTPGSPDYHRYLTPAQFAQRFGATTAEIRRVTSALRARGLVPGAASAGGLSIPVVATAATFERAFAVALHRFALPGGRSAIAAAAPAAVPATISSDVQAVLGLSATGGGPHPLLIRRRAGASGAASGPLAGALSLPGGAAAGPSAHTTGQAASTGGPQPCTAARGAAPSQNAYTADQIASAYGFTGLYGGGDLGAGTTVAVYELEPNDPADIAAYESCYGIHTRISYVTVDGGAGTGAGSGEAALDIENLIGLAPNVNVLVYQGPNSASGSPGSGPYDTFSEIINQDRAQVISVSWGQCEAALGRDNANAEDTLFQQAAIQGQTIVAASGDNGSEDCDTGGTVPQTQLAVDDPSSQPFVTGVGGTSLKSLGPRPTESVWNGSGTPVTNPTQPTQPGAGGGGVSSFWGMAPAQLDAAASLGVRSASASGSTCGNPSGFCREVPDVSADSDPSTGYLIYWNGSGSVSGQQTGWQGIGGTSGAAPLWAALMALGDSSPACAGTPIGYADPGLYRAASSNYAASYNDVATGNNDYTGTNGGTYAAGPGFDPASGLGTPVASALVPSLCATEPHLRPLAAERSTIHAAVTVRLHGSATSGSGVVYRAIGLPPGLKLDQDSGLISGRPTRTGEYTVRVNVVDNELSTSGETFTWTVGAAPRVSHQSLVAGPAGPLLAFTVSAGRRAPSLQTLAITLPAGLRIAGRTGVRVTNTAPRPITLRFSSHAARGRTLTIRLHRAIGSLRVTLGPPALSGGGRVHSGDRLALTIGVIDASAGQSRVNAHVRVGG